MIVIMFLLEDETPCIWIYIPGALGPIMLREAVA